MIRSPEFPVLLQFETRRRELDDEIQVLRERAAATRRTPRRRFLSGLLGSSSQATQAAGDCA